MSMISIKAVGFDKVRRQMSKAASGEARKATMIGIERSAREVERRVKARFSGNPIKVRTGHTRASIRTQLYPAKLAATVGSPMPHVDVIEHGKTIKTKKAKVLFIPLDAARTKAGKSRGGPRQLAARYKSTFWKLSKRGNLILFGKSNSGRLVPLGVGKKEVTIKARRPFAKEAAKAGLLLQRNVERELGPALTGRRS